MNLPQITAYLENLRSSLKKLRITEDFCEKLIDSVEIRIYSLLRHWNEISFRKGILAVGHEEGCFYEPAAKLEVKCFVVVTIRNSLFETLQSDQYQTTGLKHPLCDKEIKAFTKNAILYFNKLDFEALSRQLANDTHEDFYQNIVSKYPASWAALQRLWTSSKKIGYPAVPCMPAVIQELSFDNPDYNNEKRLLTVAKLDGMDPTIDDGLKGTLRRLQSGQIQVLYVGSFKHLSRNFEKLMRVMEFVLTNGSAFVTVNYFIQNGYIEKRPEILRAAHGEEEFLQQLHRKDRLGANHQKVIQSLIE